MSLIIDTGGPAFPGFDWIDQEGRKNPAGMTIRDYFAAQAVGALIREKSQIESDEQKYGGEQLTAGSLPYFGDAITFDCPAGRIASSAYEIADAMLSFRGRKEGAQ